MSTSDPLSTYKSKRNFAITPEPQDKGVASEAAGAFVIQKHWASRLHYDFRLELDGTMKSWAVPKGPSFDPKDKRMAVHVEDHPISYNRFEGQIPAKQYGAGKVIIWDKGIWTPLGDARKGYKDGMLKFELHGHKLRGRWAMIRIKSKSEKQDAWLLIKEKDDYARPAVDFSVVDEMPDSVAQLDDALTDMPAQQPKKALDPGSSRKDKKPALGVKAALPANLKPQLATLVGEPPSDAESWLYEIKFDGYRLLTRVQKTKVQLFTRNDNDWTHRLGKLAQHLTAMKLPDGWYDGEIVVLDHQGLPDFQALQGAFDKASTDSIVYYLFDLPYCRDRDLRQLPLVERRDALRGILQEAESNQNADAMVRFSDTFDAAGRDIVASACQLGLEGVIGKRKTSSYVGRRSADWIKLKCTLRQEFVIGGYTPPQGSRTGFGSLLLGVHDDQGVLQYSGNVGTGFNSHNLTQVFGELVQLRCDACPYPPGTKTGHPKVQWVKPKLLAEVSFAQWTADGRIRHAVFHGLRSDKPARHITREKAQSVKVTTKTMDQPKISHPERIIDPESKTTKVDLVRYYGLIAPLMLEHLAGRPVSFLRAPDGIKKPVFFQKHMGAGKMTGVRALPKKLDPDHDPLMEIASGQGLLSAAQMNVIEFHTWNAVKAMIDRPDRMIFDLDPGKGVEWPAIQEAAFLMRSFLDELGLIPFIKTSGGKGVHVVVPLQRRYGWDDTKALSQAIVQHLARMFPDRFSAKSGPRNRVGKIFIDYLRNGFGATTVCGWSARARPGMAVSVPVTWKELETLSGPDRWRIANIHERLDVGNEPWADYKTSAKSLTSAMKTLKKL